MNKELEKLSKEVGLSKEELEQVLLDKELFLQLYSLFENMSKRGKHVTIETLITILIMEG